MRCPHSASLLLIAAALAAPAASAQESRAREVYISAVDGKGAPVSDLTTGDISVKEDGASRDIVTVEPATAPLQIAILVDDSGPGIRFIREGLWQFVLALQGQAEMSIVTTAGQNVVLVDYTTSVEALRNGISRLVGRATSGGGHLLEGILEASQGLKERESRRPVIVAVTFEAEEYGNLNPNRVFESLQSSGAALHVVALGKPVLRAMNPWDARPTASTVDESVSRNRLLGEGPQRSGGRLEQVVSDSGIPNSLKQIADELNHQTLVVYSRPYSKRPPQKVAVSTNRRGVKIRAPTRAPGGR
jgi:VWFA-related protein